MKYILLIGDGMADNPLPELAGKTPLQAAEKPFLDALCAASVQGSVKTVPDPLPPGTDTATLSIFGCDPLRYFTGRSPLEAAGCGLQVAPGEISYRCNMVSLSDDGLPYDQRRILSHNADSIDGDTSIQLITWLCQQPDFRARMDAIGLQIEPTPSFRHIAVQQGGSTEGMFAAPPHDHLGEVIGPWVCRGSDNAEALGALMRLAAEKLDQHPINQQRRRAGKLPANGIWFWAEGTAVALPDFAQRYGCTGSVVSAVPIVHGIGALCGLKPVTVEGATGEIDTNYPGKVAAAIACLQDERDDFLCIHIEAPDESTHNGRLDHKLLAINQLDQLVAKPVVEWLWQQKMDFRLLCLSDHKTLMATRSHDAEPVPYFLYDSTRPQGCGLAYSEENGAKGPYLPQGTKLMELLFDLK